MAEIELLNTKQKGQFFAVVEKGVTTIGRSRSSDIFIADQSVSRRHCTIEKRGRFFHLVDLGSMNGTYYNGEKVQEIDLKDGDRVTVGVVNLVFHEYDAQSVEGVPGYVEEGRRAAENFVAALPFCEQCSGSISKQDVEKGLAKEVDGKLLCPMCIRKRNESKPKRKKTFGDQIDLSEEFQQ